MTKKELEKLIYADQYGWSNFITDLMTPDRVIIQKISIVHNAGDEIINALDNWLARTSVHTAQSFCDYINGKRLKGLTNHYAFTEDEFKELDGFKWLEK